MKFNKGAAAVAAAGVAGAAPAVAEVEAGAAQFSTWCANLTTDKFSSKILVKNPGKRQCSSHTKSRNIFMWETERCWLNEW
jgi:hypothetical protein